MTWAMVPMVFLATVAWSSLEPLGARDDLDELFGNGRLTRAVVGDGEAVDHIAGIAGCAVHRGHPRALLARIVLEERRIKLHREISRHHRGQDLRLLPPHLLEPLAGRIRPLPAL